MSTRDGAERTTNHTGHVNHELLTEAGNAGGASGAKSHRVKRGENDEFSQAGWVVSFVVSGRGRDLLAVVPSGGGEPGQTVVDA